MSDPYVSVVLPVYNEVDHLAEEIDRIRAALDTSEYSYEVLVVDDGSTDGSGELLKTIDGIRLIRFATNRGSGTARRIGTEAARGQVVVWTDVDMTYPNDDIPQLVKELEGHDQVVGARKSEEGTLKIVRVPVKWFIRQLASYLSSTKIPDLNSGFRAFRRDVALQFVNMLPKGFSCVTTMTMTFLANGYSVKHVPIEYLPRAGHSKFHWWRDTQQYLTQVVRLVMSYDPLRVFVPLGIVLTALAFGKLGFDLVVHPLRVASNTLLIFFAAFQTFAIGLIADLVVRVNRRSHDVTPASF
ncbi:MAG TPA: glycosyltransferase family 2 protein [Actinomycetota bacterium]|jgi:glycosyltransferase involved in cell wall biosynthesis|nr:glycosyltransferase family 2 protein [Actinomycetota bacterium]